jgi:diguanylate cyclase (GGDEF)-like protein/PAS domain S-box-containing protein
VNIFQRRETGVGERPFPDKNRLRLIVKAVIASAAFVSLFLLLDGASTTAQKWEGAPPCYLPVALSVAILVWGGTRYIPLILLSSVIAATINYHRPLLSWCGIPGACAIYVGYIICAIILRTRWRIDPRLSTLRDVGRFVCVLFGGAIWSTTFGVLTLYLDGLIHRTELLHAVIDWYASDVIGIVTFTPFLLVSLAPRVSSWLHSSKPSPWFELFRYQLAPDGILESVAQACAAVAAIWVLFAVEAMRPYQPLYLLFVPLVWAAVRRGVHGAVFVTFVMGTGMAVAAGLTGATRGSLPRLQLAELVMGLTGLCLGAIVSERKRAERELRRNENRLREAQRVASLGSWTLEVATGEVTWTEDLYRMFGLDPRSEPPMFPEQERFFSLESWARLTRSVENTMRTGQPYDLELQTVRADRSGGWIRARGELQHPSKSGQITLSGIAQDITERKRAEEALVFKTALLEAQAETTIDGILVVDESDRIVLANKQFGLHFGLSDELLNTRDDRIVRKRLTDQVEDSDTFVERVQYLNSHPNEKSRDEFRLTNGKVFDRYSAPLIDSNLQHRGRIWYFRDITDRKVAQQRINYLAYYDALTDLPNRVLLRDRLATALAGARRRKNKVALLFLDLDRFKFINDSLGHSVGDILLREVAVRLKSCAREQDTVARLGGDEFLVVLSDVNAVADAVIAAERLMDAMTHEFIIHDQPLNISCSLGISIYPEHGGDGETLIKNADAAMYSAKENGRNNFRFFTDGMNALAIERMALQRGLRLAMGKDEFFLMYQPQMDIATGSINGLEALLRWQHPDLGLVPPDKFIPIAENIGLITILGEWVLRTACGQARKWQDEGLPAISMAVNVSAVQFRHDGFCDLIRAVLEETGLPPQCLELELTESVLLADVDATISVIKELKAIGVTLAIDDFGIGYSSFSYLRQFQISKLKIDRSFIRDVAVNPDDAAITAAIISMATSLRLTVIAEGVENEAQMSFLRSHQCNEIQGYFFSKPLTAENAAEKLRSLAANALLAKGERDNV